jgi:hypothetical protein
VTPLVVGTVLAVAALAYVLHPLFAPGAWSARRGPATPRADDAALEAMVARHRASPRRCPACGAAAADDAEFCVECGARVEG